MEIQYSVDDSSRLYEVVDQRPLYRCFFFELVTIAICRTVQRCSLQGNYVVQLYSTDDIIMVHLEEKLFMRFFFFFTEELLKSLNTIPTLHTPPNYTSPHI